MAFQIHQADCLQWLADCPPHTFHAVITDPPYGLREYTAPEIDKLRNGKGGVWRIPPKIGGSQRAPLPRFTVLTPQEVERMHDFFLEWGRRLLPTLVPGGHLFIAATTRWSHLVFHALEQAGFEKRAVIVRLVRTLRGGYRPKGAESEFPDVSSMPRSCWEPWGLFRRPFTGTLADNLRRWQAGGLRRPSAQSPFCDVVESGRTPRRERTIAPHPSLKPQAFLRRLVWISLPLGVGTILDPFAGSGSTLAAAEALGYDSVGIEIDPEYVEIARRAVPQLAALSVEMPGFDLPEPDNGRRPYTTLPLFRQTVNA